MDLILIALIVLIPLFAQIYVMSTYKSTMRHSNSKGLTGYDVARQILDENGLNDLIIVETNGTLTDHYDPNRKVIRLSRDIYHGNSIASLAVAAHETGHAIQDKEGYFFLRFRHFLFPIVNIISSFSYYLILFGFLLEIMDLVWIGIFATSFGILFQIVTLPVEFNASNRAKSEVKRLNLTNAKDNEETSRMLTAAALTYVAGVLASVLQLLRLIGIARDND